MTTTLFTGGRVRTLARTGVDDWLLVRNGMVAAAGERGDEPRAGRVVYLQGATVVPAFCDAHVHLQITGLYEAGVDFRRERSVPALLTALSQRARPGAGPLFAGNFDDSAGESLGRSDLDRAVGSRPALVVRADMHSCLASTALLDHLDLDAPGVEIGPDGKPTGWLRESAAAAAWRWFDATMPQQALLDSLRAAVRLAYARGIGTVHEMYVADWRGWEALDVLLTEIESVELGVVVYVATDDVERVAAMGLDRIGGDWFLDGSLGSHTAWLSTPYESAPEGLPECGISYRSDAEVRDFFRTAHDAGLQTGVHAIGDAAIEQALSAWEAVAAERGADAVRARRHRIEHFECATDAHLARAAALGLGISVQPAFDRLWGGPDGMYARRLGRARARTMNRFGSLQRAGVVVGAGSDSAVTPMDPLLQIAALRTHHEFAERCRAEAALRMHTIGGHALAGGDRVRGVLAPGHRADFTILDVDPVLAPPDELLDAEVLDTWIGGLRVWPPEEADAA